MVAACGSSDSASEGTIPRTLDSAKTDSGTDTETTTDGGRGGGDASAPASYAVGGVVSGLGSAGLVLQNNAGDDLPVAVDGAFAFTKKLATGAPFAVTIKTQPATQTCSVSGENGTVGSGDISSVMVNCAANKYTIGGIASGLLGTAVLQNNGGNDLNVNANGAFAFATALETGAPYAVTIKTQPGVPSQVCTLSNTSGTVASAKVTNVGLTCVTNKFKIKLAVSGLLGAGLKLRNKGGDDLAIGADGTYEFATAVDSGQTYAVTVNTQPAGPSQTCTVTNANGTVGAADVANVTVACATNSYKIGGNVTGMVGGTLVLQDKKP